MAKTLQFAGVQFGCDPEIFIEKDGKIVGAERVIPKEGLILTTAIPGYAANPVVVLDGVQAELHPSPTSCRANLSNEMSSIFARLQSHLDTFPEKGYKISLTPVIEISKKEHRSLSPETRRLGCMPSFNVDDVNARIRVNPETYRKRSAGGHIHLGSLPPDIRPSAHEDNAARLIRIMDALVGNTSVLIDRDPQAALRRRNYGRAGEYRVPPHGLEYRTLSNFWLRDYKLFSLVMGLSRLACAVYYTTVLGLYRSVNPYDTQYSGAYWEKARWDAEGELLSGLSRDDVKKAINKNDYDLALKNFQVVKAFIKQYAGGNECGLNAQNVDAFEEFHTKVKEKGLEYWFPGDPIQNWITKGDGHNIGWESFMTGFSIHRQKAEQRAAVAA